MSPAEKVEVGGIAIFVGVMAALRAHLPARLELGDAVLGAAALLLVQGLVRDLARLRAARRLAGQSPRKVTCMCAESTCGAMGGKTSTDFAATASILDFFAAHPMP